MRLICGYVLRYGRSLQEKECFHEELKNDWNMESVDEYGYMFG